MKIFIIGDAERADELQRKFGQSHKYTVISSHDDAQSWVSSVDLIFDLLLENVPEAIEYYRTTETPVFIHAAKISVGSIAHALANLTTTTFFGFNGLPTFIDRSLFEVSLSRQEDSAVLDRLCKSLATDYKIVDDRVGLVTARVVCMIINEAYYTVQEGTATKEDIDIAMRLGTNYPFGPFEWAKRIGISNVYEVLASIYEDTKDERYKICPLLKKEYFQTK